MGNVLQEYRWLRELTIARGEELVQMTVLGQDAVAEKIREKLSKEVRGLAKRRELVVEAVDSLEDERQRVVLSLRYLTGLEWEEIEKRLAYTKRHLYRIHDKGMVEFEKAYKRLMQKGE